MDPASIGFAFSELCKKCKDEVSVERSAVSQETTKALVWRATATLSRPHSKTLAQRVGVTSTKATASPAAHKRMTGKHLVDVFGWSGFLTKATNRLDLRGYVLDTKFGPRYDVPQLVFLTRT